MSTQEQESVHTDEDLLAAAVQQANLPTLLMVLVQLTGERRWLEPPYRPHRAQGMGDNDDGGIPPAAQQEVREAALEAIAAFRAGRPAALPRPSDDMLVEMLTCAMGETIPPEYGPMIAAQLGLPAEGGTAEQQPVQVPEGFSVLIIGAGASGMCAAISMQKAGIPFTILEQREHVGGVWWENRYPGAGVDTPNHLYSYSFAPYDWSMYFVLRDELYAYLNHVADRFDLRKSIRFGTTVDTLRWDDAQQRWDVHVRNANGSTDTLHAPVVISGTGLFNPPKYPSIPGLDSFAGPSFHTARWRDDVDLTGKRVAIIGNGASCMQTAPEIQPKVGKLTIFQRSPQWAAPFEQFRKKVPDALRWMLREVPLYRSWYRARLGWTFNDRTLPSLQKDPNWAHLDRSMNAQNDAHRQFFTRYIESQVGDRTDLLDKIVPGYPPFGKRMLMDNGWFRMLTEPNVELVTESIREVVPEGVVSADGTLHEADVLIIATGFDVQKFLSTYEAIGRSGRSLRDHWGDDDAKAYLGTVIPDYPNLFVLYGPNLQTGHGGSLIFSVEMQMHYVMDALRQMLERGIGAVEVRADVHDEWNAGIDEAHDRMVWAHPGMTTYYRNSKGRVCINFPRRNVDYFHETRHADLDRDFLLEPRRSSVSV